jgi:hypothetical protein
VRLRACAQGLHRAWDHSNPGAAHGGWTAWAHEHFVHGANHDQLASTHQRQPYSRRQITELIRGAGASPLMAATDLPAFYAGSLHGVCDRRRSAGLDQGGAAGPGQGDALELRGWVLLGPSCTQSLSQCLAACAVKSVCTSAQEAVLFAHRQNSWAEPAHGACAARRLIPIRPVGLILRPAMQACIMDWILPGDCAVGGEHCHVGGGALAPDGACPSTGRATVRGAARPGPAPPVQHQRRWTSTSPCPGPAAPPCPSPATSRCANSMERPASEEAGLWRPPAAARLPRQQGCDLMPPRVCGLRRCMLGSWSWLTLRSQCSWPGQSGGHHGLPQGLGGPTPGGSLRRGGGLERQQERTLASTYRG